MVSAARMNPRITTLGATASSATAKRQSDGSGAAGLGRAPGLRRASNPTRRAHQPHRLVEQVVQTLDPCLLRHVGDAGSREASTDVDGLNLFDDVDVDQCLEMVEKFAQFEVAAVPLDGIFQTELSQLEPAASELDEARG